MLLTNKPIVHVQDLMPTLDAVMKAPRPLIIFAEKVEGAALGLLASILGKEILLRFQRGGNRNRSWRPSSQGIVVGWSARPASISTGW